MKRLFILVVLVCATIGSASAQKKDVVALTEEINALKAREVELQNKINELTSEAESGKALTEQLQGKINELATVAESNKVLAEQLQTMVAAYENLENAYKSNSEQVVALTTKINELVSATATETTEAVPQPNFGESYDALLAKIDTLTEALNNQATTVQSKSYEIVGDIHCGLVAIRQGTKYGFVNAKGEIVIAPKYEAVTDFRLNRAAFRLNDKWGLIDTNGKVIVAAQFDEIKYYPRYRANFYWSEFPLYDGYYDKRGNSCKTTRDNPIIHCRKGDKWYACYIKDGRIAEIGEKSGGGATEEAGEGFDCF